MFVRITNGMRRYLTGLIRMLKQHVLQHCLPGLIRMLKQHVPAAQPSRVNSYVETRPAALPSRFNSNVETTRPAARDHSTYDIEYNSHRRDLSYRDPDEDKRCCIIL